MKRRDWGPLLEQADGKPRGPIGGQKDHRLPDLETLFAIDRQEEAEAARQQTAVAGPRMRQAELFVDGATENTLGGCGRQTAT